MVEDHGVTGASNKALLSLFGRTSINPVHLSATKETSSSVGLCACRTRLIKAWQLRLFPQRGLCISGPFHANTKSKLRFALVVTMSALFICNIKSMALPSGFLGNINTSIQDWSEYYPTQPHPVYG